MEREERAHNNKVFVACVAQLARRGGNNETAACPPGGGLHGKGIETTYIWVFRRYLKRIQHIQFQYITKKTLGIY